VVWLNALGYRSEVTIAFRSTDHTVSEEWAKLLIKQPEFMKKILTDDWIKSEIQHKPGSDLWVFKVEEVKWYEGYDQVDAMESLWTHFADLEDAHSNLMGLFIRIGEETGDVDERQIGDGHELGYVTSHIELNF